MGKIDRIGEREAQRGRGGNHEWDEGHEWGSLGWGGARVGVVSRVTGRGPGGLTRRVTETLDHSESDGYF
jgi:hypothetical protein